MVVVVTLDPPGSRGDLLFLPALMITTSVVVVVVVVNLLQMFQPWIYSSAYTRSPSSHINVEVTC